MPPPNNQAQGETNPGSPGSDQSAKDLRLLLVEDSSADADMLRIFLKPAPVTCDITHVKTLGEATVVLSENPFDCVLLDLGLPDGQGLENVQRVRGLDENLPIVVMTGLDDEKTAAAALSQGAQAYLVKSPKRDTQKLIDTIQAAIESVRPSAEHADTETTEKPEVVSEDIEHSFSCNAMGCISEWSVQAEKLCGYRADEIVGQRMDRLWHADRRDEIKLIMLRLERRETINRLETIWIKQDGSQLDVNISITPVLEDESSQWVVRDITRQKRAEAEALRLAAIVESSSDAIIATDLDINITEWNRGAENLLGYSAQEAIGQPITLIAIPEEREVVPVLAKRVTNNKKVEVLDTQTLHKDGSRIDSSISISPVRDIHGGIIGISGIVRDISALKNAQEQLVEAERLASLGGLVAGVAHEINTPVGVAVTAASHLRRKLEHLQDGFKTGQLKKSDLNKFIENTDESSQIILTNLRRAADLIQSFKQVAVDQTSSEMRRFNVKEYLDEILMSLNPNIKKTQVKVQIECPDDLNIEGIPGVLSQVVSNLIMNSLIHGFDKGQTGNIHIKVHLNSHNLILSYSDDGKGMTSEVLEQVFDPFFTTKRGEGGSGLGMHIVYNLIRQKLNGRIVASSEPGQGVSFQLTLPT